MEWEVISKYLFGALIGIVVWLLKGAFKELQDLKKEDIIISDKVRENYWNIGEVKKDLEQVKTVQIKHDERLDKHDIDIKTIVVSHNNTECARKTKIEL